MKTLHEALDHLHPGLILTGIEDCVWNKVQKHAGGPVRRFDLWLQFHSSVWNSVNVELLFSFIEDSKDLK